MLVSQASVIGTDVGERKMTLLIDMPSRAFPRNSFRSSLTSRDSLLTLNAVARRNLLMKCRAAGMM